MRSLGSGTLGLILMGFLVGSLTPATVLAASSKVVLLEEFGATW